METVSGDMIHERVARGQMRNDVWTKKEELAAVLADAKVAAVQCLRKIMDDPDAKPMEVVAAVQELRLW